jgi:TPR repeat protein
LRGLDSCYQLAQDYIEGKDHTPKDQAKARNLLQTSCALGHSASCELLKKMK